MEISIGYYVSYVQNWQARGSSVHKTTPCGIGVGQSEGRVVSQSHFSNAANNANIIKAGTPRRIPGPAHLGSCMSYRDGAKRRVEAWLVEAPTL